MLLVVLTACGGESSGSGTEDASGFIFIDLTESHICESVLESYPPQCGEPSVQLHDLDPSDVVALMSAEGQQVTPFFWTDYVASVEGSSGTVGLSDVVVTDPVHEIEQEGLTLRTADLGIVVGEPAVWPFDLTNNTDDDVALTFTSGQRMELTLSDDTGEVYRWSGDMFFTQVIEEVHLPAGGTFPYVLTAEPTDIPPGVYAATAWVTALETTELVLEWQVSVSG